MTHYVIFDASQVFLSFVKRTLDSEQWNIEAGVLCTISCAAAIEAIVNEIMQEDGRIKGWDELKIKSKINNIAGFKSHEINWGDNHWQTVDSIFKTRNLLVHFKGENLGLFGTPIIDEIFSDLVLLKQNDRISNPYSVKYDFSRTASQRYYQHSLMSLRELVGYANGCREYEFLTSEKYEFFQVY